MKNKYSKWNEKSLNLIRELNTELSIDHKNWHLKKSDPQIRAAQLLISALSQLVNNGESEDIEKLTNQAIKWIKREIKDPGCPHRN